MMSKQPKKILTTALIAGIILTGGIIPELPTTMKVCAVYDKDLEYDPDAKPNIRGIHNLKDLRLEMKRLHWFSVCKTCLGGFNDEGTFGVSSEEKLNGKKSGKWIVYKCWDRADYDVIGEYDYEGVACRVFLQLLQKRAQMRKTSVDWGWNPFRFLQSIEIR